MSDPRVSVIVLTRRGGDHLLPSLIALAEARPPAGGMDLVLVDNGSSDGSVEEARRRLPALRIHRSERNLGFAGGVNLGVSATSAEIAVLVNDDAIVEPDAVALLVESLEMAPPDVIAAGGMLTDPSGALVDFVEGVVTFDGHALQRGFGQPIAGVSVGRRGDERLFPCGGFCALKRRDFERLGGFDDDFFAYLEDVDFGFRASLSGRRTIFVPEARARHLSGATGKSLGLAMRGVLFESNAFFVAYKNYADETLGALLPVILTTFQHRALRGLEEGDAQAIERLSDPFSKAPPPRRSPLRLPPPEAPRRSRRQAAVAALRRLSGTGTAGPASSGIRPPGGVSEGAPFEGERARMWLVAWSRVVNAWPSLGTKRRAVQALRTVPDRELLTRYPLRLVPTYPGDEELFASDFFRSLLPKEPVLVPSTLLEIARG